MPSTVIKPIHMEIFASEYNLAFHRPNKDQCENAPHHKKNYICLRQKRNTDKITAQETDRIMAQEADTLAKVFLMSKKCCKSHILPLF